MNNSILIIEDNTEMRENTTELLGIAGYKTFSARNGKEGLEAARKEKPDLILCDIMMPELDGYGVLRALENIPDLTGTPFVFLTAKADKADFRTGMDMGADDYLTKPFNGDDLLRIVSARLKKNKMLKKQFENTVNGLNDFLDTTKTILEKNILSERTVKKFRKKDVIFMEGDTPSFLYFVISGKVKTYKTNESGKEYITELHKEGDFFGYTSLLDDQKQKEAAMAIENTEVALIPRQDFFQLLYSNHEVSLKFIKLMSNNLAEAEDRLMKLAYDSARKRVAEALLFIYRKYKTEDVKELTFPIYRENISALAGISPESVSRNLSDFKEEGLIETNNGIIKIIDYKKLESLKN